MDWKYKLAHFYESNTIFNSFRSIQFSIIYQSAILFFILCIKIMETHRHSDEANDDDL